MPLILAIEPDCVRAAHLAALALEQIDAEVLIVDSVDAALRSMSVRVPELLLTPGRLEVTDSEALIARLRVLSEDGAGPSMLVTPTLRLGSRVQTVFAMQINQLLARSVTPARDGPIDVDADLQSAPKEEVSPAAHADRQIPTQAVVAEPVVAEPVVAKAVIAETVVPEPPPARDAGAPDASEAPRDDTPEQVDAAASAPDGSAPLERVDAQPEPPSSAIDFDHHGELPPPRPARDEWGMYDPDQCGFTVVLERVRRLADPPPQDDDHKRPSAIIRR